MTNLPQAQQAIRGVLVTARNEGHDVVTSGYIAERLDKTPAKVLRTIRALEKKGVVEYEDGPGGDNAAMKVWLTEPKPANENGVAKWERCWQMLASEEGATKKGIAETLGIGEIAAGSLIGDVRRKGFPVAFDRATGVYYLGEGRIAAR